MASEATSCLLSPTSLVKEKIVSSPVEQQDIMMWEWFCFSWRKHPDRFTVLFAAICGPNIEDIYSFQRNDGICSAPRDLLVVHHKAKGICLKIGKQMPPAYQLFCHLWSEVLYSFLGSLGKLVVRRERMLMLGIICS